MLSLPSPFDIDFIKTLREKHSASFTHQPDDTKPFDRGDHFRIIGLQVFLVGAIPKKPPAQKGNPAAQFQLAISTSGVSADRQGDQIFEFCGPPLKNQPFECSVEDGENVIIRDSMYRKTDYASPTPYTQWTITIMNPDQIDLSGLTDVQLKWKAWYYPRSKPKA